MNKLITVNEAFTGKNWEIIKSQLKSLNQKGVYDKNFLLAAEPVVTTREAWNNFVSYLPSAPTTDWPHATGITFQ